MGKPFQNEVAFLPQALRWANDQDISLLECIVAGTSDKNLLSIGSGGSFSAATFNALAHEQTFGCTSRALTPLEYINESSIFCGSAISLISAEGKNKDILAAAKAMLKANSPGFTVTLTHNNPLTEFCHLTGVATPAAFQMTWGKDGYLATNTLIATMALIARVYDGSEATNALTSINDVWLQERRTLIGNQWNALKLSPQHPIAVLFGTSGRVAAIDAESKLTEGALASCQIADYRQFAHGRHLQFAYDKPAPLVLAFHSDQDVNLSNATLAALPPFVPIIRLSLPSSRLIAEIFGVIDILLLTEVISLASNIDPGKPEVPEFGRTIYALDVDTLISDNQTRHFPLAITRKLPLYSVTNNDQVAPWTNAANQFCDRLAVARFKALACDFDGTFCDTDRRFHGLDTRLVGEIERLATAGIVLGFATGRGNSLQSDLQEKLLPQIWEKLILGNYSGSSITTLDQLSTIPEPDPRFMPLQQWLEANEIPILLGAKPIIRGGQLSLRVKHHAAKGRAIALIRYWIENTPAPGWRVYCSGHSIDVLTEKVGKVKVVQELARRTSADPDREILRIGDSGDIEGNDFELLNSGIGLSVATVSTRKDACWNFLPLDRRGSVGTLYYLASLELEGHVAKFSQNFIERAYAMCSIRKNPL